MDVQGTPSPFASQAAMKPAAGNPPALGQQVPGYSGGLPAQGGLSVLANPMAKELQSYGRGEDTMLVHMTPNEVNSLQGLALAHGGSLTINPHTGLPEAGWLGKLLPTILGGVLAATGIGAPLAAGIVGLGQTAITGDLKKGLMAGLGAFGGASLAGAAGLGGAISKNAFGALGSKAGIFGANMGAGTGTISSLSGATQETLRNAAMQGAKGAVNEGTKAAMTQALSKAPNVAGNFAKTVTAIEKAAPATGFLGKFGEAARAGLPGGVVGKVAPMLAAQGVVSGIGGAMTPSGTVNPTTGAIDNSYQGPYYAQKRTATFAPTTEELLSSSKQRTYFDVDMPEIYNSQGQVVQAGSHTAPGTEIWQPVLNPKAKKGQAMYSFAPIIWQGGRDPNQMETGYAEGGEVKLAKGSFIIPARAVADAGNGFTEAGFERFAKLGGVPLRGMGDGVSDDIPARIGDQPARVAAGEVYMPPEAVRRAGGAKKLYALVNEAHKARKRGENSPVAKGLAAL